MFLKKKNKDKAIELSLGEREVMKRIRLDPKDVSRKAPIQFNSQDCILVLQREFKKNKRDSSGRVISEGVLTCMHSPVYPFSRDWVSQGKIGQMREFAGAIVTIIRRHEDVACRWGTDADHPIMIGQEDGSMRYYGANGIINLSIDYLDGGQKARLLLGRLLGAKDALTMDDVLEHMMAFTQQVINGAIVMNKEAFQRNFNTNQSAMLDTAGQLRVAEALKPYLRQQFNEYGLQLEQFTIDAMIELQRGR